MPNRLRKVYVANGTPLVNNRMCYRMMDFIQFFRRNWREIQYNPVYQLVWLGRIVLIVLVIMALRLAGYFLGLF